MDSSAPIQSKGWAGNLWWELESWTNVYAMIKLCVNMRLTREVPMCSHERWSMWRQSLETLEILYILSFFYVNIVCTSTMQSSLKIYPLRCPLLLSTYDGWYWLLTSYDLYPLRRNIPDMSVREFLDWANSGRKKNSKCGLRSRPE